MFKGLQPFHFLTPVITKEKFSEMVGVGSEVVQGWVDKGHVPTVKIGRHRLINIVLLTAQCLDGQVPQVEEGSES